MINNGPCRHPGRVSHDTIGPGRVERRLRMQDLGITGRDACTICMSFLVEEV